MHRRSWSLSGAEIGDEFALFLAKNLHVSSSTLKWRWLHAFHCQKRCTLRNSSHSSFCLSQMARQVIEEPKQATAADSTVLLAIEKNIRLTPQTIRYKKRVCAWGCARGIKTTWKNLQIEKHKSGRRAFRWPYWFVLFDLQMFSSSVYPPSATSRTNSFFQFPIVLVNLMKTENYRKTTRLYRI